MKKNVLFGMMALAMGAMTACSVEEVVDQAETNYIGFDAFANKVSRTRPTDFPHNNFSVWGAYNNAQTEVFKNTEVTYQSTDQSWSYGTPKPWVANQTYHFAAVAPYGASYTYDYTNQKYSLGEITIDNTTTAQIDYMTAEVKESVTSGTNPVEFTFNHIVSKIDFIFKARTTGDNPWQSPVRIEIKKIELKDVPTKNTYSNDAWGNLIEPTTTNKANFTEGDGTSAVATTTYDNTSSKVAASSNVADWLVVPQGTTTGDVTKTLEITCDVYDAVSNGTKVKENATASVEIKTKWEANHYYTYTVSIGTDILGPNPYIIFDVKDVTNWDTTSTASGLDVTAPSTQQGN